MGEVVKTILLNIVSNDNESITSNMRKLPLATLTLEQSNNILFLLLSYSTNNPEACRLIIQNFDDLRIRVDPLPTLIQIFNSNKFTKEVLEFVVKSHNRLSIDYYIDIVNYHDNDNSIKIAKRLFEIIKLSKEEWQSLYDLTENIEDEEYENQKLREFFKEQLSEVIKVKPTWLKSFPKPLELKEPPVLPSVESTVNNLMRKIKDKRVEIEETLIVQYSMFPINDKLKMIGSKEIFDDTDIFREFGPLNTMYSDSQCNKYGGCRMFTCTEFEFNDTDYLSVEEQVESTDWFTGYCINCDKDIDNRKYAVRKPCIKGGWIGCYCSVKCLGKEPKLMINILEEQLESIGINDI